MAALWLLLFFFGGRRWYGGLSATTTSANRRQSPAHTTLLRDQHNPPQGPSFCFPFAVSTLHARQARSLHHGQLCQLCPFTVTAHAALQERSIASDEMRPPCNQPTTRLHALAPTCELCPWPGNSTSLELSSSSAHEPNDLQRALRAPSQGIAGHRRGLKQASHIHQITTSDLRHTPESAEPTSFTRSTRRLLVRALLMLPRTRPRLARSYQTASSSQPSYSTRHAYDYLQHHRV